MTRRNDTVYPGIRPGVRQVSRYAIFDATSANGGHGFSRSECRRIIAMASVRRPVAATVAQRRSARDVEYETVAELRSATIFEVAPEPASRWIYERIVRAAQEVNERRWQFDLSGIFHPIKVIRYSVGDHYTWHTDLGAGVVSDRKLSVTAQLSAPGTYAGARLEIVAGPAPATAPVDQGGITFFPSYLLHRVTPVSAGVRWALVTWIQGPPFR
jgi:PKHD-type hydroxylase